MEATSFVGRVEELADLAATLSRARLITVTGPGGVGKTRVALRAAEQAEPRFPDGVCVVDLSRVSNPELLADAVAEGLGLPGGDARPALDAVADYLGHRVLLLVLDNCEHLADACAELTELLLQAASDVTVLATSRQTLNIAGENVRAIAPFSVTGNASVTEHGDAVRLFADRAVAVRPGFRVTGDNAGDVTAICQSLDGIPLAIELAAARLDRMPLCELVGRLPDIVASGGDGDSRHQTLRAAIEWSYDLCTPAEQELWQRLSVFEGGFSVEAAEEVCGGQARGRPELPRAGVIHAIISLVDKSVLTRETSCGPESTATRYRMLDTIRAFGAARLADSGNAHAARVRLLNRYLAMARYCAGHFLDDDQVDQFRRLQAESASIRAVLSCALEDPREDLARRGAEIAVWLLAFWMGTSQQREGTYWFGQVIERFPGRTPERARALIARCYLRAGIGPAEESIADGRAGVRLADELGDEEASARGRLFLGHALTGGQRFDEAARVAGQAREALTALGDRNGLLLLNSHLATLHDFAGDYAEAVAWYERGIAGHGPGERWQTGWLHIAAGDCYARMDGKMAERRAALRAALEAKDEIGDQVGLAYVLEGFALLAFEDGRLARSAWLAGAAVPLWEKTGSVLGDLPHLLALRERVRGETRERLGSTQFELLFARGRGYPLDQVVQLAASDADKLPPLPPRSGETGITSREHEIATLAAQGLSRGETADRLGISKRTVDAHLEHIHAKLGLSTQEQLTAWIADQPPQT